ncbi:MAG: oligosaccharide flippase family protein [Candidatus Marsarchaeota archaeon]|nr:oligosaccharide flippase family protein [Candidatus Marsarchaeota archaeon]
MLRYCMTVKRGHGGGGARSYNSSKGSTAALSIGVRSAGFASFIFIGKILSLLLGAAMIIIVSRVIGPSQYGIYTLGTSLAGFVASFGAINAGAYLNRIIPKLEREGRRGRIGILIGDSVAIFLAVSALLMLVCFLLSGYIAQVVFGSAADSIYVYAAALAIAGIVIYPIVSTTLISVGTKGEVAWSTALQLAIQAVASIILALLGYGALGVLVGYISGYTIASIITLAFIALRVRVRVSLAGMLHRLKEMFSYSLALTASNIVGAVVSNFSVIFLGILLVPAALIGQYGIAMRIGQVIDVMSGAISLVLIPMFSTAFFNRVHIQKIGRMYEGALYYAVLFSAPIVVYASVLSKDIILTVFTAAYSNAVLYMPLVSIGILIGFLGSFASYLLASLGRVEKILKYTILGGIVEFAALLALVPYLHVIGVIVATFYIGGAVLAALYLRAFSSLKIRLDFRPLMRVILSCLLLALFMLPLAYLSIRPLYIMAIGVVEALVLYPALLAKTGAVTGSELGVLSRVSGEVPLLGGAARLLLAYTWRFI